MKQYNSLIAKYKLSEIFFQREKDEIKIEKAIKRLQELSKEIGILSDWFTKNNIETTHIEITEGFNIEYREQRMKLYKF